MGQNKIKTLVVEDHPKDAKLIEVLLKDSLAELSFADNLISALKNLAEKDFDIVLLDLFLPESKGIKTLHWISNKFPNIPVIALTRLDNEEIGLQSVKEGAQDFLVKGTIDRNILIKSIRYSIERFRNREKLRESEERYKNMVQKLQNANAQLEEFTYSVSHDLRAPLRAITGFSEILGKRYRIQLDEKGQHYVNNIVNAGRQMGMLIDDLLSYSRLGQGSMTIQAINMEEFFAAVITSISSKITESHGSIELPKEHPEISSNSTLLKQVFTNLFINALTFLQKDIPPVIRVSYDQDPQFWHINIADNGIGISDKHFEKIFNIFQRLHSQDDFPGTGIGLSIVNKSLRILKGSITIASKEGKGTTFTVKLPRGKVNLE